MPDRTSQSKARYGRSPTEIVPRREKPKSMTLSVIFLVAVFALIIGFIVALSIFAGRPAATSRRPPSVTSPEMTSSKSAPEVASSACHVVGNGTTCFRFASNYTARRCSAVGGFIISVNQSASSSVAASAICYHNVCSHYVVDNKFCFLNRSSFHSSQ